MRDRREGRSHRRHVRVGDATSQGARARRRPPGRRRRSGAGDRCRRRGLERVVAHAVGGARRGVHPRVGAARRPVASDAHRGHDAQPVEDGASGRDRRCLRAHRLLALQRGLPRSYLLGAAHVVARRLEPHGVPAAGGLRIRRQPLQLHGHRRQPDGVPGVDGEHGRLEAGVHVGLLRVLPHAPAARGGIARRRDQPRLRAWCRDRQSCAREPGPRRDPLHRLHVGVPGHVAHGRRRHRALPELPTHRRRDRGQGLHRRAPVRRPRGGGDGGAAWLFRVPGPEVLGRLAHLRPPVALGRRHATASRTKWPRSAWATSPTSGTSWVR